MDLAAARIQELRSAEQVVGDEQALIVILDPDQTPQRTGRIVDCVVDDAAALRVGGEDTRFRAAGDEVVAYHARVGVKSSALVAIMISQADAHVAIEDHVAFDDTVTGLVPQKDGSSSFPRTTVDAGEHVVTDHPTAREHGVDPADVVAIKRICRIGRIVRPLLGSIVVKQTELDPAVGRPFLVAVRLRHGRAFHAALPDIVNDAVADRHLRGTAIRVDLESVPFDALDREFRNCDSGAARDADQFAVLTVTAVEHDPLAVSARAAQRDPIGVNVERTRQQIRSVGDQDRGARLHGIDRRDQLVDRSHLNDLSGCRRQRRSLREPSLMRRFAREGSSQGPCGQATAGKCQGGSHWGDSSTSG